MKLDQFLYMSEAEGNDNWVSTDMARLNASVNDFTQAYYEGKDINDRYVQDKILRKHNLSLESIPDSYKDYIMSAVNRKVGN